MNEKDYLLSVQALLVPFVKQMKNKQNNPRFKETYRTLTILLADTRARLEDIQKTK